jgi:hypothetical protein
VKVARALRAGGHRKSTRHARAPRRWPTGAPILAFLNNTNEALAGILRPGRAGANTAADHIAVLDQALTQIPDVHRPGFGCWSARMDTAGCTKAFLTYIRALRDTGCDVRFSVGAPIDADDEIRDGAQVADLTGLLDGAAFPAGTRFIVRRERPHPGAQLDLFDTVEGFHHQLIAADSPAGSGSLAFLDARHRAHARVEDRIRCGKVTGFSRFPLAPGEHQHHLAGTRTDRHRPARLGPDSAAGRRRRQGRAEEAVLPTPSRRRPPDPRRPLHLAADRRALAPGTRPRRRVRPPGHTAPPPDPLTGDHASPDHDPKDNGAPGHRTGPPPRPQRDDNNTTASACCSTGPLSPLVKA